ncbi:hypothetical protein AYO20_07770 [Fonsecaea nubica]|uniref:alanine--glyoxylate transaminase n=1 Tax=Fonsecaea nubica TaxID=856822 RepID=A0A178CUK3_9EURO|nr:hypothetical protein AYO20_07770 [Fonsecaea nubica]OAL32813.1 hypothetical protein AYO20_07770 [Fonsecaea nubica]
MAMQVPHLLSATLALAAAHRHTSGLFEGDCQFELMKGSSLMQLRSALDRFSPSENDKVLATTLLLCLADVISPATSTSSWRSHLYGAATLSAQHSRSNGASISSISSFLKRKYRALQAVALACCSKRFEAQILTTPYDEVDARIDDLAGYSTTLMPILEEINDLEPLREDGGSEFSCDSPPGPPHFDCSSPLEHKSHLLFDRVRALMAKRKMSRTQGGGGHLPSPVYHDLYLVDEAYHHMALLQIFRRGSLSVPLQVIDDSRRSILDCLAAVTYQSGPCPGVATLPPLFVAGTLCRTKSDRDQQSSYPRINTPYTIELDSLPASTDDIPYVPPAPPADLAKTPSQIQKRQLSTSSAAKMSSQPPHPSLLIPGPIEITDEVSQAMSHYAQSHVGQPFVNTFGESLTLLRDLFQTKNPGSQPFVLAGSGTLGWDLVAANLVEPGEDVLVLHTGYFGDSFADCLSTYGAKPTQLKAPIGDKPQLPEIEAALKEKKYKAVTVTHVDTSTGVLSQIQPLSDLIRRVSPETLLIVDGVCSVGGEEINFDKMDIDVCLTASQKAIGCPPGLSIVMVSERAMNVYKSRKSSPGSYYASFKNWTPIMQNYEAKKASYFATPPTQLVQALNTSLKQILAQPLEARFAQHRKVSEYVKSKVASLGLKQLATDPANAANTMTAIYLPEGLTPPEILPKLMSRGVVFAGGLHREIAARYIRFGHMGVSAMDESRGEIDKALEALKDGLAEVASAKSK